MKWESLAPRLTSTARAAVDKWGALPQLRMLQEECGELIAAINQMDRGRVGLDALAAELADVLICTVQAAHIIGPIRLGRYVLVKLARLEQRIEEGKP